MKLQVIEIKEDNLYEYDKIYNVYLIEQFKINGYDEKIAINLASDIINKYKRNQEYIKKPNVIIFELLNKQDVIGFIEAEIKEPDNMYPERSVYISNLYIKEHYRSGFETILYCNSLFEKVKEVARNNKLTTITADCYENNTRSLSFCRYYKFNRYSSRYIHKIGDLE